MLEQMPSCLFKEWVAYSQIEPFGEWRSDLRAGIISSTIANCNRSSKTERFSVKDFMPSFEPVEEKTPESLTDKILSVAKALGAKIVKREPQ